MRMGHFRVGAAIEPRAPADNETAFVACWLQADDLGHITASRSGGS